MGFRNSARAGWASPVTPSWVSWVSVLKMKVTSPSRLWVCSSHCVWGDARRPLLGCVGAAGVLMPRPCFRVCAGTIVDRAAMQVKYSFADLVSNYLRTVLQPYAFLPDADDLLEGSQLPGAGGCARAGLRCRGSCCPLTHLFLPSQPLPPELSGLVVRGGA